ncbi:MAG: autotransporter outer membrane beta-barrel domain-containing protein [Cohaesibacter sp.]|jgi:uncharacterized protein with beta-barrel porin domain|nr:autotransporter outer membrane beta-barrel domain-containing protein [Cohaesibacter sp.]
MTIKPVYAFLVATLLIAFPVPKAKAAPIVIPVCDMVGYLAALAAPALFTCSNAAAMERQLAQQQQDENRTAGAGTAVGASASAAAGGDSGSGGGRGASSSSSYAPMLQKAEGISAGTSTHQIEEDDETWDLSPVERSFFVEGLGGTGRNSRTASAPSSRVEFKGVMAGADLYANEWFRLGLIGLYAQVDVDVNANNNQVEVQLPKGGVKANTEWGNWHLDGLVLYGPEFTKTKRTADVLGVSEWLSDSYTNHRITSAFELGYTTALGPIIVQPGAGVELDWHYQEKTKESGPDTAAIYTRSGGTWTGKTKLGLSLSAVFMLGDRSIVPTIGGHWEHRFGKLANATRMSFDQGATYEGIGQAPIRDVTNLFAGLNFNLSEQLSFDARYSASFTGFERMHTGSAGFRLVF